jgi:hypothetical protein
MKLIDSGVLCPSEGGERSVATFPSITRLAGGALLASYRIGRNKDSLGSVSELRRSSGLGATWSAPEAPFSDSFDGVRGSLQVVYLTPLSDTHLLACSLWVDREAFPGKPLFNETTEGCLPMKILVADSFDLGRSFGQWREIPVTPDVGPPSLTGPILRLPSGRLVVSIETNKPYLDTSPWLQRVVYCYSSDEGLTWTLPTTVCDDPTGAIFHWDQRACVTPDGKLVAFSWVYERPANRYLPIRRHVSLDEGATWTTATLDFADQPSHPAVFPDGRTVLAWVDRYGSQSIRARSGPSADGPFDASTEVVIYEAGQPAARTSDTGGMLVDMGRWSFGLPYAEALPNGEAIVVYYAGTPDRMDVRWQRLGW